MLKKQEVRPLFHREGAENSWYSNLFPLSLSLRIRRLGLAVFVQKSIEPVKLPVQTLNQMFGLARARQVVIFAREENDFGGDAEVFERAKPLFALLDRHAIVVI